MNTVEISKNLTKTSPLTSKKLTKSMRVKSLRPSKSIAKTKSLRPLKLRVTKVAKQ